MKALLKRNGRTAMIVRFIALVLCAVMMLGAIGCTTSDKTPADDTQNNTPNDTPNDGTTPDNEKNDGEGNEEEPKEPKNIVLNAFYVPMYSNEIRDKMIKLCADAEIDVISHVMTSEVWNAEEHTFEFYKEAMAKADEYGIKMLTREIPLLDSINMSNKEIRELANRYKGLPGFGGFYVVDEPFNPSPYARIANILNKVCPDARINVNFLPVNCYANPEHYLRQLCDYGGLLENGGVLSLDCYCFPNGGGVDEMNLFTNYETIRKAGLITGCDTAVYVQSVGMIGGFNYRRPSEADLRYNMMSALAYGIKEIQFFTFGSPGTQDFTYTDGLIDINCEPTELYYSVCNINKKIHTIGTYLAACDAKYVYHSQNSTDGAYEILPEDCFVKPAGPYDVIISLMEERVGNGEYVMVVNKDIINSQKLTLTFKNMNKVYIVDDKTGELVEKALDGGKLTLDMVAGDCALIKLPEGNFIADEGKKSGNVALGASVYGTDSKGSENCYLYNLTDGVTSGPDCARLGSDNGKNQHLTVDLGEVYDINRIDLLPAGEGLVYGKYNPKDFKLLVSEDGQNWTEVATSEQQAMSKDGATAYRFDTLKARYVRITVMGLKGSSHADLAELEVYAAN